MKRCQEYLDEQFKVLVKKVLSAGANDSQSSKALAHQLQTLETEIQTTLMSSLYTEADSDLGPARTAALLDFLDKNLVQKIYKPII